MVNNDSTNYATDDESAIYIETRSSSSADENTMTAEDDEAAPNDESGHVSDLYKPTEAVTQDSAVEEEGALASGYDDKNTKNAGRLKWLLLALICCLPLVAVAVVLPLFVFNAKDPKATAKETSSSNNSQEGSGGKEETAFSPTLAPMTSDNPTPSPTINSIDESLSATTQPPVGPPTDTPSAGPTSPMPTKAPTVSPTTARPTGLYSSRVLPLLQAISKEPDLLTTSNTPQSAAVEWMLHEDQNMLNYMENDEKIVQRYSLLLLDMALANNRFAIIGTDECEWFGVTCKTFANSTTNATNSNMTASRVVDSLIWANQSLNGQIPQDIGLLSDSLRHIDLAENNELSGPLPDGLYDLTELEYLYLHQNQLSGSISTRIGELQKLVHLYLGDNLLNGPFPAELGGQESGSSNTRPLAYLSLYNNQISGTIPENLNLRNLFYLDLGKNNMGGPIPSDWIEGNNRMRSLRHLYLDENSFNGSLPEAWPELGQGRMAQLILNDNQFTGQVPGRYEIMNHLNAIEIQNNDFSQIDSELCKLSVFVGGELVSFRADCSICACKDFCDLCYN